jgi:uncharacterized membrane protein YpjA
MDVWCPHDGAPPAAVFSTPARSFAAVLFRLSRRQVAVAPTRFLAFVPSRRTAIVGISVVIVVTVVAVAQRAEWVAAMIAVMIPITVTRPALVAVVIFLFAVIIGERTHRRRQRGRQQ